MKISFIVPAYNVSDYIGECLESILKQDVDKEIIIIDDGSTDDTNKICRQYEKLNSNIRLYTKRNGGLSSARNYGMKLARGKYVWFVDSDDYIVPNSASKLIELCEEYNLDLIRGLYSIKNNENGNIDYRNLNKKHIYNKVIMSGIELIEQQINADAYEVTAWLGIYNREYLEKIGVEFFEGVTYEDHEYILRALCTIPNNRVMAIDEEIYVYRNRQNSITKIYKLKDFNSIETNINRMINFVNNIELSDNTIVYNAISALYYQLTRVYGGMNKNDRKHIKTRLSKNNRYKMFKFSYNKHQKIKIFLFNYFKFIVDLVYYIKKI